MRGEIVLGIAFLFLVGFVSGDAVSCGDGVCSGDLEDEFSCPDDCFDLAEAGMLSEDDILEISNLEEVTSYNFSEEVEGDFSSSFFFKVIFVIFVILILVIFELVVLLYFYFKKKGSESDEADSPVAVPVVVPIYNSQSFQAASNI